MVDYKKVAWAAGGVTGISYVLGLAYAKFFPQGIGNLAFATVDIPVRQQIQSGIDTTIAGKLLSYLGGVIPQGGLVGALIMLYVAAFVIVLAGALISERITFGKSPETRFAVGLTLAAVLGGLVLGTMSPSIGAAGVAVAMFIYFGLIALAYSGLRRLDGFKDFLPAL